MSSGSQKIVPSSDYMESLEDRYEGLEMPSYKLREWFSKAYKIFFDCESSDQNSCLERVLKKRDIPSFTVLLVVQDETTSTYEIMDVSFRSIGRQTFEDFIRRYQKQLESMTKLNLESRGKKYLECVGYNYKLKE